jgi:predicted transcriptional regulator
VPHVVNFQDASRLQRILTPRRLELVRSLMDAPAESMRDLADRERSVTSDTCCRFSHSIYVLF